MAAVYKVEAPDGSIIEFEGPDGLSQKEVLAAGKRLYDQQMRSLVEGQLEGLFGETAEPEQAPDRTLGEQVVGAGEAALTALSGATTGTAGGIIGFGQQAIEELAAGEYGSPEAAQRIRQASEERMARQTYTPRTEAGQEAVQALGEFGEAIAPVAVPLAGMTGELSMLSQAISETARTAPQAIKNIPEAVSEQASARQARRDAGAAETERGLERATTAQQMDIPFSDESGLTTGQATRNFEQLQFERETAKRGETGAPLRDRYANQTATILANFDAMIDRPGPIRFEPRDIGREVSQAVENRLNVIKKNVNKAYDRAREAGEMASEVTLDSVPSTLINLDKFSGVAPNVSAITKEAIRLGIVERTPEGDLVARPVSLNDAELFRQFINDATDFNNPQQGRIGTIAKSAVDDTLNDAGVGGELYREARKLRAKQAQEFENVGITKRLLSTKPGTDERTIAFEDVFKKVILDSPVEEMNKLRGTLLKAGPDGKQAWADMKSKLAEHIKRQATSASQTDERGQPLISVDKLSKTVRSLDDQGKLESIFGKRQSQQIRDLAEMSQVIYTAPPGAINYSNTASALIVYLETLASMAATTMATGTPIPVPVIATLKGLLNHVKDKKLKARIEASLKGLEAES